jgi:hypothetical protein
MERRVIRHAPKRIDVLLTRAREHGRDIIHCPADDPEASARCPDCDSLMMYRGLGRLRNGTLVHTFECIHSPREVHSVSIVISE